mgnify:FL=1|jgi:hypothetical protein|tara:strand:- start:12500 stop:12700 length:201 start_codon:yes stop_codon:yes gene_type:complete
MHLHLIEDANGQLVDVVELCSDSCHQYYCDSHDLEYRGWYGCCEAEFNTTCEECGDLIEGVEGECV